MEFLSGEQCTRCGGPLLAEFHKVTEFVEESMDYVTTSKVPCYACGHLNTIDGTVPHIETPGR